MEYCRKYEKADRSQRQPLPPQEQFRFIKELATVVPKEKIAETKDKLERERAVPPHKRYEEILDGLHALNLDESGRHNRVLASFGVKTSSRPQQVEGIRSQTPRIQFANNQEARINPYTCNWDGRNLRVSQPGQIDNIVCIYTNAKDKPIIERAVEKLKAMAQKMGIQIGTWDIEPNAYTPDDFPDLMESLEDQQEATKKRCLLLHFDYKKSKSHDLLKLLERRFSVVTQQITIETASDLPRKPQIVQNILLKLNCKIGGLNYQVASNSQNQWVNSKKVMFVGYNVVHPTPQSRDEVARKIPPTSPSIVGFSFNGAPNPEAFIGDFHYQAPKQERVREILYQRMKWMLKLFKENREYLPEVIFVTRNDISEDQYNMMMTIELAYLRNACTEFGEENDKPGYSPKFMLIITAKKSKPTYYHILVNDLNLSMSEVQPTMAALCSMHQITNSPISIPEPVCQAGEWAKRGRKLWRTHETHYKLLPRKKEKGDYSDFPIDFEVMTKRLSYWNSPLQMYRVNA
ncbi:hypothetical protein WR25_24197 [Diploscapter pachys]|uniref:Piwi domain-containing protein n=1 Tax=Diploscapter pachys TaxID=2018661 RepID=A0A2A2KTP4_9BILA|nr:hypothetical protein WR25_24197 [Diploscapter pachys]